MKKFFFSGINGLFLMLLSISITFLALKQSIHAQNNEADITKEVFPEAILINQRIAPKAPKAPKNPKSTADDNAAIINQNDNADNGLINQEIDNDNRPRDKRGFIVFENIDFFPEDLGEAYVSFKSYDDILPMLIGGWREFQFSLGFDAVLDILKSQYPWIEIKNIDTLGIDSPKPFYLQSYANEFFDSLEFLFDKDNRLKLIRLNFAERWFSFLELLSGLEQRYGKADSVRFAAITWIDEESGHTIELNRSGVIRYIRSTSPPSSRGIDDGHLEDSMAKTPLPFSPNFIRLKEDILLGL